MCDFVTKLCRQEAEIIQNHEHVNFRNTVQGEDQSRKCDGIKQDGGEEYLQCDWEKLGQIRQDQLDNASTDLDHVNIYIFHGTTTPIGSGLPHY